MKYRMYNKVDKESEINAKVYSQLEKYFKNIIKDCDFNSLSNLGKLLGKKSGNISINSELKSFNTEKSEGESTPKRKNGLLMLQNTILPMRKNYKDGTFIHDLLRQSSKMESKFGRSGTLTSHKERSKSRGSTTKQQKSSPVQKRVRKQKTIGSSQVFSRKALLKKANMLDKSLVNKKDETPIEEKVEKEFPRQETLKSGKGSPKWFEQPENKEEKTETKRNKRRKAAQNKPVQIVNFNQPQIVFMVNIQDKEKSK